MLKVNQAKTQLEKGNRVMLVFAPKSGAGRKNQITQLRMDEIVKMVEGELDSHGKQWKESEVAKRVRQSFWEPKSELKVHAMESAIKGMKDRQKEKDEKKEARRQKAEEKRIIAEAKRINPKSAFGDDS